MNVAILGLGKLGLPMAAFYAGANHRVIGVDVRDDLIEQLSVGAHRTDEPEVNTLLKQHAERLAFTRLPYEAVLKSEIVFVVVPTPSKSDGTFDSAQVVTACQQIGNALHDKTAYTLVVVVSTLMPGQMDADVLPALGRASEKRAGVDFGVCYSPEFIALGRVIEGLRKPDYVLIGEYDEADGRSLVSFYMPLVVPTTPFRRMSFVNAELAKLATNAYLSLKIAFANVLGQICEQIPGANVDVVTQAVGSDHRIGGAYLRAGLPAGGVCLPRDLAAIGTYDGAGFLKSLPRDNDYYVDDFVAELRSRIARSARVVVLGTGYSVTSAIEINAYGRHIADALTKSGYAVWTDYIDTSRAQELVEQFDAVIIALPLDSYKALTFHAPQQVFDVWRVLDPTALPVGVSLWQLGVGANVVVQGIPHE